MRGINHFTVISDQVALSHIYGGGQELNDFPEELRNLMEVTLCYNFNVQHMKGTDNTLADYFSRNPIWGYGQPVVEDVFGKPTPVEGLVRLVQATTDKRWALLEKARLLFLEEVAVSIKTVNTSTS